MNRYNGPIVSNDIVSFDTNVLLYAYVWQKPNDAMALGLARQMDEVVLTNIVIIECERHLMDKNRIDWKKARRTIGEMYPRAKHVIVGPANMSPAKLHHIDSNDLIVMDQVNLSGADIFVTNDKKWFRQDTIGLKAIILSPKEYIEYCELREKNGDDYIVKSKSIKHGSGSVNSIVAISRGSSVRTLPYSSTHTRPKSVGVKRTKVHDSDSILKHKNGSPPSVRTEAHDKRRFSI